MNRILLKKILGKFINTSGGFVNGILSEGKSKKRWSNLDSNRKLTEAKAYVFPCRLVLFFAQGVQE